MNKDIYVNQLNDNQVRYIKQKLKIQGITGIDLDNALNSRLIDLEEIISVNQVIKIKF